MSDVTEVEKWEAAALRLFGNRSIRVSSAMLRDKAMELADALEKVRKDTERLDWLDERGLSMKFADVEPLIPGPVDADGYREVKYVGDDGWSIRIAIDAAREGARDDR
jgi:hypothetical protein